MHELIQPNFRCLWNNFTNRLTRTARQKNRTKKVNDKYKGCKLSNKSSEWFFLLYAYYMRFLKGKNTIVLRVNPLSFFPFFFSFVKLFVLCCDCVPWPPTKCFSGIWAPKGLQFFLPWYIRRFRTCICRKDENEKWKSRRQVQWSLVGHFSKLRCSFFFVPLFVCRKLCFWKLSLCTGLLRDGRA